MAAKTFEENTATSGKYLWSTDANWGGTKPSAGDTVTIPAGLTCTLDVDIALGTGSGTAMTVNGTLDLPSTSAAGTYGFTLTGNVAGTGTISAGTSGTALPNNVIYDIEFSGAFGFTGVLNFQLYCTHPTNKIIYLSGAEAAGQTELSVDTDVTGDIWAEGDLIRIDDITTTADSEIREIAAGGIAAGAITVTSGLTNAKTSGSYVIRVTRNIMIRGGTANVIQAFASGSYIRATIVPSSSSYNGITYFANAITFDGVISGGGRSLYRVQAVTMSGILTGASYSAFYSAINITVTADGVISGTGGLSTCSNIVFSGTMSGAMFLCSTCQNIIFDGNITYCINAFASSSNIVLAGGSITNCAYGLHQCSNICGNGTTFNNTYDMRQVSNVRLFGCTLSGTENFEYDTDYMLGNEFAESFDHDGVADAYKAWTKGGIVQSLTDSPPTGYTMYYGHAGDDSGAINFRQKEIDVEPGKTITVSGYIKIDDATDHTARPPRIEIIDAYEDPLVNGSYSALAYDEVADPDGSDSSWQAVSCSWTNSDGITRHVFVRMSCKMVSTHVVKENFMILELEAPNYPATTDVKDGVFYGPDSNYEGEYVGGGGGGGLLQGNKRGNKQ